MKVVQSINRTHFQVIARLSNYSWKDKKKVLNEFCIDFLLYDEDSVQTMNI